ncbi:hypothetical protein D3C75_691700 [compost metagenome]
MRQPLQILPARRRTGRQHRIALVGHLANNASARQFLQKLKAAALTRRILEHQLKRVLKTIGIGFRRRLQQPQPLGRKPGQGFP